jgi:ABC-type multidrug transport system permease subunit
MNMSKKFENIKKLKKHGFNRVFKRSLSKKLKRIDFQITLFTILYFIF